MVSIDIQFMATCSIGSYKDCIKVYICECKIHLMDKVVQEEEKEGNEEHHSSVVDSENSSTGHRNCHSVIWSPVEAGLLNGMLK